MCVIPASSYGSPTAVKPAATRAMVDERVDPLLFRLSRDYVGDMAETVSLLYPLAVGNLLTACMNLAAEIGVPTVTADVVKGV